MDLHRVVRVEPAPVPARIGDSTWPCAACDEMFALAEGWRVVHRLGGVERLAYVCKSCAKAVEREQGGPDA